MMAKRIKLVTTALDKEKGRALCVSGPDSMIAMIYHAEIDRLTLLIDNINRLGYMDYDTVVEICNKRMGTQPFCKYKAGKDGSVTILEWSRSREDIDGFLSMMINSGNGFLQGGCEEVTFAGDCEPSKYYDAAMSKRFAIRTAAIV